MVASTDIKFYVHTNTNAPQLQNAFGCMIDVLDACLINGFGSQAVATLTASGTTVTATYGSAHNYLQYQVAKIAGVNQAEFNGEHRILSVPDANTITFELAAVPSVTTATGTITSSLPSLGWEKPFSSTNETGGGKAAYRSLNLLLPSRPFLRVVDELDPAYNINYAKYAKVGIVEDMTDIDTMLGVQAPFDNANPNKNWVATGSGATAINGWAKWYYAFAYAINSSGTDAVLPTTMSRNWLLVGNSDHFYILPLIGSSLNDGVLIYGFGAFNSLLNVDAANTFLAATTHYHNANSGYAKSESSPLLDSGSSKRIILQRSYTQAANYGIANNMSLACGINLLGQGASVFSGNQNYIGNKNLADVVAFVPVFINESVLRGELLNFFWLLQQRPYSNYQVVEKNNKAYIAAHAGLVGQVVFKIGDL